MTISFIRIGLALVALMLPSSSFAARSDSFILEEGSNAAETYVSGSTSYTLQENGISWHQLPLVSTSFHITTNFTAAASSAAGSSQSSSESAMERPPSGGRRGSGGVRLPPAKPAASDKPENAVRIRVGERLEERLNRRAAPVPHQVSKAIRSLRRGLLRLSPGHLSSPKLFEASTPTDSQLRFFRSSAPVMQPQSESFWKIFGTVLCEYITLGSAFLLLAILAYLFARTIRESEGLLIGIVRKQQPKHKARRRSSRSRRS